MGGNGEQISYVDAATQTLFLANWIVLVSLGFSYVWYSELLRTADACEDQQGRIKLLRGADRCSYVQYMFKPRSRLWS